MTSGAGNGGIPAGIDGIPAGTDGSGKARPWQGTAEAWQGRTEAGRRDPEQGTAESRQALRGIRQGGVGTQGMKSADTASDGKAGAGRMEGAELEERGQKTGKRKRGRHGGRQSRKKGFLPAFCSILSVLLLLVVVGICIPMTVPRLFGYEVYTVVSGSMEPAIPVGSAIYLKSAVPEEIKAGEVIAFYRGRAVVTHRVTENHTVSGEFITKGDANAEHDLEPVPYSALLGRMEVSVPVLGSVMAVCSGSMGKAYLAGGVAAALLLHMLGGMLRRTE